MKSSKVLNDLIKDLNPCGAIHFVVNDLKELTENKTHVATSARQAVHNLTIDFDDNKSNMIPD